MTQADIPAVAGLEAENPGAWSAGQLEAELTGPGAWHFVGREPVTGQLAAYICGRLLADEAEIFRLAVQSSRRRRGVGVFLLAWTLAELDRRGVTSCFLEVRAANRPALALYQSCGFRLLSRRAAYYRDPLDDALVMVHNGQMRRTELPS